jgi:hypothetical protein
MPKTKKSSTKKTAPKKGKEILKKVSLDPKKIKVPKIVIPDNLKPVAKILGMVVLIIGSLALIDLAVQYLNNDYSVAVVNGSRISKRTWNDRLQKAYGSAVASQLIEDQIIKEEAKKADVTVSKEEIDTEIDRIVESIGGQEMFESALDANNITLEELRDQIEIDLLSTKILAPTLEYTEEDVKEFFNQYSDVIYPEETAALEEGELLDFEKNKERTEEIYIQQQVQTQRSSWLNEKMAEYKIQDNSTGKPKYGFLTITTNIVNNLLERVGNNNSEE